MFGRVETSPPLGGVAGLWQPERSFPRPPLTPAKLMAAEQTLRWGGGVSGGRADAGLCRSFPRACHRASQHPGDHFGALWDVSNRPNSSKNVPAWLSDAGAEPVAPPLLLWWTEGAARGRRPPATDGGRKSAGRAARSLPDLVVLSIFPGASDLVVSSTARPNRKDVDEALGSVQREQHPPIADSETPCVLHPAQLAHVALGQAINAGGDSLAVRSRQSLQRLESCWADLDPPRTLSQRAPPSPRPMGSTARRAQLQWPPGPQR